jgi:pyruvate dehydrogenase E2 component (dihydrolipoamide acetyltransferase)
MGVFRMPSLGSDMEEATLAEWLVQPGDTVSRGDVIAVVETQKGAIEVEVFDAGPVSELLAEVGQTLAVGAPMAMIGGAAAAAETAPEPEPEPGPVPKATPEAAPAPAAPRSPSAPAPPPPAPGAAPPSSPAARALAARRGIDLAGLAGSGPGGAIVLADVEAAGPASPPAAGAPGKGLDLAAMREAIAAAMARSKREVPHYYLSHEIDLQAATDWLAGLNAERPPERRILMGALFVKAVSLAAGTVKGMNGQYGPEGFHPSDKVNAGVAVALRGGGLIAPAIHDAGAKSLDALMTAMRDLVQRARTGRLRSSEMSEGTITVSSLGESGVDAMTAVIYPPQVAIVAFGTARERALVRDGAVVARTGVTVTLSADHRVSDGRRGAKFLSEIDKRLQDPEAL